MAELLETTRKMTRYILRSHINTTNHTMLTLTVTTPVQVVTPQLIQTQMQVTQH